LWLKPLSKIRELTKLYAQGEIQVTALDRITLDIAAGEFLALMGPSGSGKSTLLHIIAGVDRPTSGECLVQGVDVTKLNESQLADWRNHNVGFIFQTFNLIPVLTAAENVELPLLLTQLDRASAANRLRPRSKSSASPTARNICRASCPADRNSASPSPARW
jgi:putative ABC transport system ATP-binding protein